MKSFQKDSRDFDATDPFTISRIAYEMLSMISRRIGIPKSHEDFGTLFPDECIGKGKSTIRTRRGFPHRAFICNTFVVSLVITYVVQYVPMDLWRNVTILSVW